MRRLIRWINANHEFYIKKRCVFCRVSKKYGGYTNDTFLFFGINEEKQKSIAIFRNAY